MRNQVPIDDCVHCGRPIYPNQNVYDLHDRDGYIDSRECMEEYTEENKPHYVLLDEMYTALDYAHDYLSTKKKMPSELEYRAHIADLKNEDQLFSRLNRETVVKKSA